MTAAVLEASAVIIYDNGGLASGANANNGVAAPAGTQWSEASNPYGNTQLANTLAGVSCSVTATVFRCADDFNVPVGQTWTINSVIVFAYQTGFAGGTSPITAGTLQIWNGRPGDAGSVVVFGDTTTNRLASSTDSSLWRIFSSVVGVGANPPSAPVTNRKIWQNTLTVAPAAVLTAGNYWISWNTAIGTAAHFAPTNTIPGLRTVPGWNARQNTGAAWQDSVDAGQAPTGSPTPAFPVPTDFPFKLDGSIATTAVPRARPLDFDGDGKTDFAVARATGVSAPATWYINNAAGTTATSWGLGIGFDNADEATPADFDGDGKTDIAVWRPHATAANFFILQSSNGTLKTEQFGKTGDSPVVGYYDNDNKADVAVFRDTPTAADPCGLGTTVFYHRPSATPATNFLIKCWGAPGDEPYPGDFDGDGRWDFSVFRNSGGNAVHYQDLTTAGPRTVSFGLFTDLFLVGDYDADGRHDLGVARDNGAGIGNWYFNKSGTGQTVFFAFGASATDVPVPGDYDGDGKTDFVAWRSGAGTGSGNFIMLKTFTSPGFFKWGSSTTPLTAPDYPVGFLGVGVRCPTC